MALHAAQGATAPFDAAKVESIKSAISSGTFQINPGAIADGLISSVTELLGKK
jgi:negative regulator of flagellin synthesis FlgM